MNEPYFEEHLIHGTAEFPVGVYNMDFGSSESSLFPLHYHNEFEFLVITKGAARVHINGETVTIKQGEGLFINSGTLHSAVSEGNSGCGFIAVVFSPHFIASEYEDIYKRYISAVINGNIAIPVKVSAEGAVLARKISKVFTDKGFAYEVYVKAYLTEMMAECIAASSKTKSPDTSAKADIVKNTLSYIHDNYMNTVTLDDLSSCVHISKEHLCRVFREVSEFSPIVYLNRYRIIQSVYMLRSTTKRISQISSDCGFNNSSYFNKQFMRFMKCTPSKYRENSK